MTRERISALARGMDSQGIEECLTLDCKTINKKTALKQFS